MTRPASAFKQSDVTRAVKAVKASGDTVQESRILPDGTIIIIHGGREVAPPKIKDGEWDSV